jgi:biopolymer transport protein ExbD
VSRRKRIGRSHEQAEEFELNITSIIDCFTVLIAFMLVSASFVSIAVMDSEVAAGAAVVQETTPGLNVAITVQSDHTVRIDVSGTAKGRGVSKSHVIPARTTVKGGLEPDYAVLSDRLSFMKGEWPDTSSATLTADSAVAYREVIKTMEVARKAYPSVLLGGF